MRNQVSEQQWQLDQATALRIVGLTVITALVAVGFVPLLVLMLATLAGVAQAHVELRARFGFTV